MQQREALLPAQHTDFIVTLHWGELVALTLGVGLLVLALRWWRRRRAS